MIALPILLVAFVTGVSVIFAVQAGALTLAGGLALLAIHARVTRASRTPWRSQRSDVSTLALLAVATALLALLLP